MNALIPMMAVLWQSPADANASNGWGPLFWLWFAVIVVLLALLVWRAVSTRRRQPPIDPKLR
jgi:hypothetical protein